MFLEIKFLNGWKKHDRANFVLVVVTPFTKKVMLHIAWNTDPGLGDTSRGGPSVIPFDSA